MFRTIGDPSEIRRDVERLSVGRVEAREVHYSAAAHLQAVDGLPTTVVAFTSDIPVFDGTWGRPLLIGPGSIHVAHTADERIAKQELEDAVKIYARMVRQLIANGAGT
jgi:acetylornithine deacetylase